MATKKQWKEYLKLLRKYKKETISDEIEAVENVLDEAGSDDPETELGGPGSNPPPPPPPPPRP